MSISPLNELPKKMDRHGINLNSYLPHGRECGSSSYIEDPYKFTQSSTYVPSTWTDTTYNAINTHTYIRMYNRVYTVDIKYA